MKTIIILLTLFPICLYSQGNFLVNFYNRDFKITKQEITSLYFNEPGIKITKDSANTLVLRGVSWLNYKTRKIQVEFVDDTISIFIMIIDNNNATEVDFENIKTNFVMQFGRSYNAVRNNDDIFYQNWRWEIKEGIELYSVLQLDLLKPSKDIVITYINMPRSQKILDRKRLNKL